VDVPLEAIPVTEEVRVVRPGAPAATGAIDL
jgi:hypothetical protein